VSRCLLSRCLLSSCLYRSSLRVLWLGAWLVLGLAATAVAQEADDPAPIQGETVKGESPAPTAKKPGKEGQPDKKAGRPRSLPSALPPFTPESEAAALRFVGDNHPELSALLLHLKSSSPKEYQHAIRELSRTTEKLAQTKVADPERYDLELEDWKVDSEIRLLAAKLTMGDDKELRGKLRNQLIRKNKLQLQRLELEKHRAEQRVKKLDANIERLKKEQEQIADRQMAELLHTVRKDRPAKRKQFGVEKAGVDKANDKSGTERQEKPQRSERAEPVAPAGDQD
jgi:hypothetical protein